MFLHFRCLCPPRLAIMLITILREQPITNDKFVAVLFLLIDTVLLYVIQFKLEIKKNTMKFS